MCLSSPVIARSPKRRAPQPHAKDAQPLHFSDFALSLAGTTNHSVVEFCLSGPELCGRPCRNHIECYYVASKKGEEGCVHINAADFTYEYFQRLINRPEQAYKEFYNLKVAYDECLMRNAEVQAKYTADLNHKNQKIANLETHIEEMARSGDQEAIISSSMLCDASSSGVAQSGGTYGGSITTSSGHVRQGNDFAGDISNHHPFSFVFYGSANVEIQVYTPAG
ncbi:uncharacterized protein TrAtP1_009566 [Trichoderma atroviride]|uniref:uncharacterized protein n=1 Tax=Hypocrea atroviridis TaxID=63577 RepID=UPI003333B3F5|nr:hypothetical protein TrAtP1_009566 [Trichoderma atroviride]